MTNNPSGLQNSAYTPAILFVSNILMMEDKNRQVESNKAHLLSLKEILLKVKKGGGDDSAILRALHYIYLFLRQITRFFIERRIHVRSAALTYYIMFALVPLFAFVMGIAKGFGFDSYIKEELHNNFPTYGESVNSLLDMVQRYLDQTQNSAFVGIGLCMLFWSVFRMFHQIERAFNDIWGIETKRPWKNKIPNYIAIAFFVPLLILFSSAISFYFKYAIQYFSSSFLISPSLNFLLMILPYFVSWISFTLLYWFIPNTQVRFKYAAISGLIFSIAFMIFKEGYLYVQSWMTNYNAVYGTLAAIPFLLMFLQTTWVLILLGCSFTFTAQCLKRFEHDEDVRQMSHRYFEFASLVVTKICTDRYVANQPYVTLAELTDVMPYRMAKACSEKLCRAGVLDKVEMEFGQYGYRPRLELNELSVSKFYLAIDDEGTPIEQFSLHKKPEYAYLWKFVESFRNDFMEKESPLIKSLEEYKEKNEK